MKNDVLVDKILDNSESIAKEPTHVLVRCGFRTWKLFKREFFEGHEAEAYDIFNKVMEQLSQNDNVIINRRKTKVTMKDISPFYLDKTILKYTVEVYWRNK